MAECEFTIELNGASTLAVPSDVSDQLPKSGRARVIILTDTDAEESEWLEGAYEQFLRDHSAEDAIYDAAK